MEAGIVKISSGMIAINDPCYVTGHDEEHTLADLLEDKLGVVGDVVPFGSRGREGLPEYMLMVPVPNGEYPLYCDYNDEGRVAHAWVELAECSTLDLVSFEGVLFVDAGLILFYDPAKIWNGYDYMEEICGGPIESKICDDVIETSFGGIAVSSGYGDGEYPIRVYTNVDGEITKISVEFIWDEEDEDDEEDYDY